ncbi:hypothetical protein BDDG_09607 [Blastomyces dermatitidis ATCC 18188]|uniref:Uncharacterized protein n=1 Tax=Ajellomyces dermatitidis (strain ATCC 18188 / CBS 674.68) TaxID=653446 RepID=F2TTU7_AJEDA|nr:hypothetical protein BDDG_09607 [Blastomyces dermatitidis ATCC 18188]
MDEALAGRRSWGKDIFENRGFTAKERPEGGFYISEQLEFAVDSGWKSLKLGKNCRRISEAARRRIDKRVQVLRNKPEELVQEEQKGESELELPEGQGKGVGKTAKPGR